MYLYPPHPIQSSLESDGDWQDQEAGAESIFPPPAAIFLPLLHVQLLKRTNNSLGDTSVCPMPSTMQSRIKALEALMDLT